MPTFAGMKTVGGYNCGEVASALQKMIRRGDEEGALFWGTELDLSGYGEYVWKRLRIIASEDIGLADPMAAVLVHSLYESWVGIKKKGDEDHPAYRLFLTHALLYLARAKKSRIIDNATVMSYRGDRPTREIPDCALDKHTGAGRRLGRGEDHFVNEASRLENLEESLMPDPYLDRATIARQGMDRKRGFQDTWRANEQRKAASQGSLI